MQLTLRIKKVYLDQIRSGEKKIEYRANTPYYNKIFKNKSQYKRILLHYQNPNDKLQRPIKRIRKVNNPYKNRRDRPDFLKTGKVWAIYL